MKDLLAQPFNVYRYVAFKRVGDVLPALAVLATAMFGIGAGILVLASQTVVGMLTDLAFFRALRTETN